MARDEVLPIPLTLEELCNDDDWAQVFADQNAGNVSKDTEAVGNCSTDPAPTREDVTEIICLRNGENDGADWVGVFKLKDGRYLHARGGCDYTGWD